MKRVMFSVLLAGYLAPAVPAATPLDLIPADATAAIAIRNLTDLEKKGDQLAAATDGNIPRFSMLFNQLWDGIGVNAGLDPDQSMVLMLASREEKRNENIDLLELLTLIVVAVPFKDLDQMSGNFNFKAGELKPDQLYAGKLSKPSDYSVWFYARGRHLFIGASERAVLSVVKAKPLRSEFDAARQKELDQADIFFHLAIPAIRREWQQVLDATRKKIDEGKLDEQDTLRQFLKAAESFRFLLVSARLDDGVALSTTVVLSKEAAEQGKKLAALLGTTADRAGLRGLPAGNVVAAQAAMTDGARSAFLVRALLELIADGSLNIQPMLTAAERLNYVNVFTDIWQKLRGSRVGMYQTAGEHQLGLFSFVAILDTDQPDRLLADLKDLARFADARFLTDQAPDQRQAVIEKLIRDLGDNDYQVRHSASTRLMLLGEPALPFLEQAVKSNDLEVRQRADRLRAELARSIEDRRQQILAGKLPTLTSPSFAFLPVAEKRGGHEVQVIRVKLQDQDAALVPQLKHLLGPDWDRIRLAVQGKHVVALIGSDVALLDAALANLKEDRAGLAADPSLANFARHSDAKRSLELHVSAQRAAAVMKPDDKHTLKPGLTSFAFTVDAEYLRFDIWLPTAELALISRDRFR